jgi:hypothetical protein
VTKAASWPSVLLRGAAAVVSSTAVAMDVLSGEHPSHAVVLGLAAAVAVLLLRRLREDGVSALPAACGAVAAQPVLHLSAAVGRPAIRAHDHQDLLHILVSDAPGAFMQVVAPALMLIAVAVGARLLCLLINAVCAPLVGAPRPLAAARRVPVTIRALRPGSILRWCGWVVFAARRGPPRASGHALA